jgi:hypothetical protein
MSLKSPLWYFVGAMAASKLMGVTARNMVPMSAEWTWWELLDYLSDLGIILLFFVASLVLLWKFLWAGTGQVRDRSQYRRSR